MGRPATGSVRFEGGRWKARLTVDGEEYFADIEPAITDPNARAQAKAAALEMSNLARAEFGGAPEDDELAEDWFERWWKDKKGKGQSSWKANRSHVDTHILPVLRGTPIARVTARQLETIVQRLDAKIITHEITWKTASNVWSTVTKAFDDAKRSKVLELRVRDDNPAKDVRGPDRGVDTAKVHIYPAEFLALVGAGGVPVLRRRFYTLGIYNYMRPSEVEALDWEDVDLARETIHIRRGIDAEGDEGSPKQGRARLPFDIEPALMPLLRAMHKESGGVGLVIGAFCKSSDRARILREDLLAAGVKRRELHECSVDPPREWMTAHDLRTTGITWMAVRGDPPLAIMARAGHADLEQTQGYIDAASLVRRGYGEVFPALPEQIVNRPVSGDVSGENSRKVRKTGRLSVEDMGIETSKPRVRTRSRAEISLVKPLPATPEHPHDHAGSRGSPETPPEMHPARAAFVDQLQHAIRKAVERRDFARAADLAEALEGELRAIAATGPSLSTSPPASLAPNRR